LFLEFVSLDRVGSVEELLAEARRLEQIGTLTAEQIAELDLDGVAAFWTSSLGQEIRSQKPYVRRELAFTARFSLGELETLTGLPAKPGVENELIVAEGKADLAIILPQEIRLVDFKTDRVQRSQLPDRAKLYSAQLGLYARALSQIYRRPVTERWLYFLRLREALRV
jgi:ATP-dependent helicase/nuclease subunit A